MMIASAATAANGELDLRGQLGIPADAMRVLVFGESSHWDTNWIKTSEEYFADRIDTIFDSVFAALAHDPRRVYAIESVFFLKLYWERRPLKRELIRQLLLSRQLRLLSVSLTTPDTLLPGTETILRDYLVGQEWLRENHLDVEVHVSYFPDNFGHSPSLPTLMQALGVRSVGVTRVDGMYFVGSDYRRKADFPRPGSTAESLQREHKSLDFVWRDDDGAEVLCHWNAFTYFQGDMLAHAGIIRWSGQTYAVPWRSRKHIARRLRCYVRELGDLTRTPYMFCPIGMDFNAPIADLGALLDRYNREVYPETGVFAVSAGLDDYLALVDYHRQKLPVLACDPNPYWMGFYATRPEVKQRPMRIARTLLLTEKLAAALPRSPAVEHDLRCAWSVLSLSNHHDYITGTSPDRVWREEQQLWLDQAEASAKLAWNAVAPTAATAIQAEHARVEWARDGDTLTVTTRALSFRVVCQTRRLFYFVHGRTRVRGARRSRQRSRGLSRQWRPVAARSRICRRLVYTNLARERSCGRDHRARGGRCVAHHHLLSLGGRSLSARDHLPRATTVRAHACRRRGETALDRVLQLRHGSGASPVVDGHAWRSRRPAHGKNLRSDFLASAVALRDQLRVHAAASACRVRHARCAHLSSRSPRGMDRRA